MHDAHAPCSLTWAAGPLIELQDAALAAGSSLCKAVPSVPGKAGASLSAFVRIIDTLREESRDLPLPEVVGAVLDRSGLVRHYQSERDGAAPCVDARLVDADEACDVQRDRGERLVDLEQVDIVDRPACLFQQLAHRRDRGGGEFGWFMSVCGSGHSNSK
mgnify:CR=1 FL=1